MPKSYDPKVEGAEKTRPKPKGAVAKTKSVNKKIRDLQRLLQKHGETMPAEIKAQKEKDLEDLRSRATSREYSERERKTVVRYRMLKFIERQKLARKIRHAEKELEAATSKEDKAKLSAEIDQLKDDVLYIAFFPKTQNYLALFPKAPYRNPHAAERQMKLRKEIASKHQNEKQNIKNGVIKVAGDEEDEKEFGKLNRAEDVMGSSETPKKNKEKKPSKFELAQKEKSEKAKAKVEATNSENPNKEKKEDKPKMVKKENKEKVEKKESDKEEDDDEEVQSGWKVQPPKDILPAKKSSHSEKKTDKKTQDSASSKKTVEKSKKGAKEMKSDLPAFSFPVNTNAKVVDENGSEKRKNKKKRERAESDDEDEEGADKKRRLETDDFFAQ